MLPRRERQAAVRLFQRPEGPVVRDAPEKPAPNEFIFHLSIDIDLAGPRQICREFELWLAKKLENFKQRYPKGMEVNRDPARERDRRSAALTRLAAYRLHAADVPYRLSQQVLKAVGGPCKAKGVRLPIYTRERWSAAVREAEAEMKRLFTPKQGRIVPSLYTGAW